MYTTELVLGHLTLVFQAHFDPGRHAVGQLLEQGQGEVLDPCHPDHNSLAVSVALTVPAV